MIILDNYFDKIFIINLASRSDRWAHILKIFQNLNMCNFERFPAIKPTLEMVPKLYQSYFKRVNHSDGSDETYIVGCYGCRLSHLSVIKLALERKYQKVLILEDDVEFAPKSQELFSKAVQQLENFPWEMLYFTGNHTGKYEQVTKNLIRIHGSQSAVSYAVNNNIYKKILDKAANHYKHIDVFYKEMIHPNGKSYCIQPHLTWNKADYSDIEQGFRKYKKLNPVHEDWLKR